MHLAFHRSLRAVAIVVSLSGLDASLLGCGGEHLVGIEGADSGGGSIDGGQGVADTGSREDGCALPISAYEQSDGASCWPCVTMGCSSQLAGCAADCSCHASLLKALTCANTGGVLPVCFLSEAMSNNSQAFNGVTMCVTMASSNCGCEPNLLGLDASLGCSPGGGTNGGNGNCTSDLIELCGGTTYQVVCSCPQARCACFGPSSQFVDFPGCPYCPESNSATSVGSITADQVFALCGFPNGGQ
jgi:hypothetical protein